MNLFDDDGRETEIPTIADVTRMEGAIQTIPQGQTLQRVATQYVQAVSVQKPRNLRELEKQLLYEAGILAESAYYSWSVKNNETGKEEVIEGPSVELAMAAARAWGNCAVEQGPVVETPTAFLFTSYFIDLEAGTTISRPFRQSRRWKVYGRMDDERKEDVRFQIGVSKSNRNVILSALPRWLTDHAMATAKAGVRERIEKYIKKNSIEAARKLALQAFSRLGVTEERILARFDYQIVGALTLEDLVKLQGDLRAIENGAESAATLFPVKPPVSEEGGTATEAKSQTEKVKGALKAQTEQPTQVPTEPALPLGEKK